MHSTATHLASSHHRDCSNDGLHLTNKSSNDIFGIRGGGKGDVSPTIAEKTRSFVSKNFFLIGMGVAVSFAKLLPEVSYQALARMDVRQSIFLLSFFSLRL